MNDKSEKNSNGVDELIQRLKIEGVKAAQDESNRIITNARSEAERIIADAKKNAETILKNTKERIDKEQSAAHDAMAIAYRDLIIDIKNHIKTQFSSDVERMVKETLVHPDMIKSFVQAACNKILGENKFELHDNYEILLPEQLLKLDDITKDPESASKGELADFIFSIQKDMLSKGITFKQGVKGTSGIQIRLVEKQIQVDLTDESIKAILMEYLNPRFRAVLEGIIH